MKKFSKLEILTVAVLDRFYLKIKSKKSGGRVNVLQRPSLRTDLELLP